MKPEPSHPSDALSDQALAWIVRLHSGEAGQADWAAFQAWRAQSAEHEAAAREAETLWDDASQLHRDPVTGLIRPGRRRGGPSRRAVIGGIAGLAAAGAAGMWLTGRGWRADHATGVAETLTVGLPDGSKATLNAMTAIDVDYSPGLRRIALLQGQVFFEAAGDGGRPFVVDMARMRVRALGTAFDIDFTLPDGGFAVAVTEHSVRVEAAADADAGSGVVVAAGERLVVSSDGRAGAVARQDAAVTAAWRSGMYIAEGRRLDEVAAAFNAYHDGWIVVRGEEVRSLRVNAVLDLRTPDASLDALADGLPVTVRHMSRFLTVISAR